MLVKIIHLCCFIPDQSAYILQARFTASLAPCGTGQLATFNGRPFDTYFP